TSGSPNRIGATPSIPLGHALVSPSLLPTSVSRNRHATSVAPSRLWRRTLIERDGTNAPSPLVSSPTSTDSRTLTAHNQTSGGTSTRSAKRDSTQTSLTTANSRRTSSTPAVCIDTIPTKHRRNDTPGHQLLTPPTGI